MQRIVFIHVKFGNCCITPFKRTIEYETFSPRFCSRLAFSSFRQSVIFT